MLDLSGHDAVRVARQLADPLLLPRRTRGLSVIATAALTAAVFLLPATVDRRAAQAGPSAGIVMAPMVISPIR